MCCWRTEASLGAIPVAIERHGIVTCPPGTSFGPRTLRNHELAWIVKGDSTWHWPLGEATQALPAGSVLLCRPGMTDAFTWNASAETEVAFVHFDFEPPAGLLPPPEQWPTVVRLPPDDVLRPLLRQLMSLAFARGGGEPREFECFLLRHVVVSFITGFISTGGGDQAFPPAIESVLRHVNRQWADGSLRSIPLCELAECAATSAAHLNRLFNAAFGHSPVTLLRMARLQHGAELLRHSNLLVGQIAVASGFPGTFEFGRAFAKAYGMSPRAYRKRVEAGAALPPDPLAGIPQLLTRLHPYLDSGAGAGRALSPRRLRSARAR